MIGKKYGRLTIVRESKRINHHRAFECVCDCGNVHTVREDCLVKGVSKSCGCLLSETNIARKTTHGCNGTPTYETWHSMKGRCQNIKNKNYGGRGISVCERWNLFENFLEDMGEKPFDGAQIDRIDNNKGYSPDNCRWATSKVNSGNRRSNVKITYKGETKILTDWANEIGISLNSLRDRLYKMKWPIERALTEPKSHRRTKENERLS